jgi:CubicO group peptidase (beta-lactamase class C family)
MKLSRRHFVQSVVGAAGLPVVLIPVPASAQAASGPAPAPDQPPGVSQAERDAMSKLANAFMQKYSVPGLSVAVGHDGVLLYQDAFGLADSEKHEAATPKHLFRIASVTKTITSVAIFSLIEQGRLQLTDKVFGPGAITGTDYGKPPYHPQIDQITIEHLLTHTSGGWPNTHNDPMFMNLQMNQAQLIAWALRNQPLDNPPGQHYAYSNFGYCVLGRVIEKITGRPYADYVRDSVLKPCSVGDMTIAGNTLAQRQPDEVKYYSQSGNPYSMNVTRMDSHGGWIAAPADLVQFFMHVDGFPAPPNILKPQTIEVMTTASAANAGYAKGWEVNKADNWWHSGFFLGTSTIAVRTHTGFCWAAFTNTRTSSAMDSDLDKLVWNMVGQVKSWKV